MFDSPFHLAIAAILIFFLFGGRKFRGGPGKPPTHPLPATGALETSRGAGNPDQTEKEKYSASA
jgi:hypothetical protein